VNGDYLKKVVEWGKGNDVSSLTQKAIRLRFEMRGAKLFGFQFTG
jgi:hypothetical protein